RKYIVTTYTGNVVGAGTDANVFINIIGEKSESGIIALKALDRDIFEKNEIDTFMVDSEDLGTLQKIRISNDLSNPGPGWFLDKVTVTSDDGDFYEFPYNSWIEGDKSERFVHKEIDANHFKRSLYSRNPWVENFEFMQGCNDALGMMNGNIKDYQITSSTSFNDLHLPYHARLNKIVENSFGGWCPFKENNDEFLQISLDKLTNVTGIAIQGLGLVDEWTTSYLIRYKSIDDYTWQEYKENNLPKIFNGNIDQNTSVQHWLNSPILTKVVRIYPHGYHSKACLRVELYGCESGKIYPYKLELRNFSIGDSREDIQTKLAINYTSLVGEKRSEKFDKFPEKHFSRPVLYISFDNISSNGMVQDASGNKNDAKVHPPVDIIPFSRSCGPGVRLNGGALSLDGEFFIDKPSSAITILVWVKLFSNGGQHSIFSTWYAHARPENSLVDNIGYHLEVDRGRVKWSHLLENGVSLFNLSTGLQIPAHTWIHIGVTYDSADGKSAIFVNSKLAAQNRNIKENQTLSQDWSGGAVIGKFKNLKSLNGEFDEFYIFRTNLSPSKIEGYMKNCLFELVYRIQDCNQPIGIESRVIVDNQLTASSSYNLHFPYYARLNLIGENGDPARTAWCADGKDTNPHIDINLGELKTITGISVQGLGLFDNWVTGFLVCYSTNDNNDIFCIKENGIDKIFDGNIDKNSIVRHYLKYPVASRQLRIRPVSWFGNHLCMRFELYGCALDLFPDPFDNDGNVNSKLIENEESVRGHIPENCDHPFGISSGELDDLHFSSSSDLDVNHQSRFARLITDISKDDANPYTYLNISRKPRTSWCAEDIKNITQIDTQGYYGKENWVTSFRVGYSDDLGPIRWYSEGGVDKIFEANKDQKHIVNHYLKTPITAQYIRINPRSWVGPHICMRLELFGCNNNNIAKAYDNMFPSKNMFFTNLTRLNDDLNVVTKVEEQPIRPILISPQNILTNLNKQSPYKWSSLIEKYPELIKHGVTPTLLESVSQIVPNLDERITNYFTSVYQQKYMGYEPSIESLLNPTLFTESYDQNDSRKGIIEHFLKSNVDEVIANPPIGRWEDPNSNEWSQFTECSQQCGVGVRMRQRNCDYPICPSPGVETEIEPCFMSSCENYGYKYVTNEWSPFSSCNKACGVGKSMRFRICDDKNCPSPGYETQTVSCYMPRCPVCNYDFETVEDKKIILDISGTGNNALMDGDAFIAQHEETCGFYLDLNLTGRLILPDQTFRSKPRTGISISLWIKVSSIFATEISNGADQFMGKIRLNFAFIVGNYKIL
ncbi:hypothetical protein MXB_1000, partial [Myxobolus squamalis]